MPFLIDKFDGLTLPRGMERGDLQSMGTGMAGSDFVRMPGGGFYDNYGDGPGPRELDAIVKTCVLYAVAGSTVREQVEALRVKLGKRGVLEVLWHDGAKRWQWARLTRLRYPRPFNARLSHLPVDLTFMPAAGWWYGDTLTVDINTLPSGYTQVVNVTNAGNAYVTDAVIEFEAVYTGDLILTLLNYNTSQQMAFATIAVVTGDKLMVDVGRRTIRLHKPGTAIATIERNGAMIVVTTTGAHGLIIGDEVAITGTNYDGFYAYGGGLGGFSFRVDPDPTLLAPHGPQSPAAGFVAKVSDLYSAAVFSDKANWFWLAPGVNEIFLTAEGTDPVGNVLTFSFYPTWA